MFDFHFVSNRLIRQSRGLSKVLVFSVFEDKQNQRNTRIFFHLTFIQFLFCLKSVCQTKSRFVKYSTFSFYNSFKVFRIMKVSKFFLFLAQLNQRFFKANIPKSTHIPSSVSFNLVKVIQSSHTHFSFKKLQMFA